VIDQAQLAESLGRLDAGTRALLDLSLRRAIPDDQVAKVLGVDAMSIPPRRARGIAELADMMDIPGPAELAALLIAIPDLPEEAWGVPAPAPFAGNVSRARRAKAFRRVAVAASPLVALGAVMAAVLVSSSDHSSGGSGSAGTRHGAGTAGSGGSAAATAAAPDARHGLPAGVQLTLTHPHAAHAVRHTSVRHHRAHPRHVPGVAEPAILARQPNSESAPQTEKVVLHRSPVVHTQPRHVTHHHHAPAKPKQPTSSPSPAPVQTPSQPVSSPAPSAPSSPPVQISAPETTATAPTTTPKPTKTPPPQPSIKPPTSEGEQEGGEGGGCHRGGDDESGRHDHESSQGAAHEHSDQNGGGKGFTPPGLFRRRH
jgi:hypothetical protein